MTTIFIVVSPQSNGVGSGKADKLPTVGSGNQVSSTMPRFGSADTPAKALPQSDGKNQEQLGWLLGRALDVA